MQRHRARAGFVGANANGAAPAPENELNSADIVIGKGRAIVEAMACGRAAYVYDQNGGDGWITPETYESPRGGQLRGAVDARRGRRRAGCGADLGAYRPEMGTANRDLAVLHHSVARHAHELVELFRGLAPRAPSPRQTR